MGSMDRRRFLRMAAAAGLTSLPAGGMLPLAGALSREDRLFGAPARRFSADYPLRAVPLEKVEITDAFWAPRMEVNRTVSLPYCFAKFEGDSGFSVSKLIEAAAYTQLRSPDPELVAYVDGRIERLVEGLERRIREPEDTVRVSGHFLEAAVAWSHHTGKGRILEVARGIADRMDQAYGPGKRTYISGHEGLKIGLVSLYRATGDERYWRLAKFFADERGKDDYPRTGEYALDRTYAQDHLPVVRQTEAVGHCVRATFLYIPMADIAALDADEAYRTAVRAIWEDAVHHKSYLTAGIGSIRFHEQFGAPYELPNLSAWNETCAAYGNVVWNHRMFLLERDGRYADLMERALYNALLVGVSRSGDRFFYQNPLKSFGDYERFEWINVPCCPPNVVRMLASVGSYVYATDAARELWVNLYVQGSGEVALANGPVRIAQETRYPWDGEVTLHVDPAAEADFALLLRIPGWARDSVMDGDLYRYTNGSVPEPEVRVNGRPVPMGLERGYLRIERSWRWGDVVELSLPMPVRRVEAHPQVQDDRGRVALERGPLVYCAEWPDNGGRALDLVVPDGARLDSTFRSGLLGGLQVIEGEVQGIERREGDGTPGAAPRTLTAIPYFAWANRGMGEMAVWMAREPEVAWLPPVLPRPVVEVRTSGGVEKGWTGYNDQNDDLGSVYDRREPINSADQSHRFFRMRPPEGEPAWLEYELEGPTRISRGRVYFFDDKRFCKLPDSWRLLYREGDAWVPVRTSDAYDVVLDDYSAVRFEPVTTTSVRLEVEPRTVHYKAGEIGPPGAMFLDEDIAWREFGVIEWEVG